MWEPASARRRGKGSGSDPPCLPGPWRTIMSPEDRTILDGTGTSRRRGDRVADQLDVMTLEVGMR